MSELTQVLRHVVPVDDPNTLVGLATGDDAAVYRLSEDRALVVTVDFFTPIVDDPYDFGRIAATNALSDVYAMGGRPLFVLNLVGFPRRLLSEGILGEILRGASEVTGRVGVPTLGGHSIDDPEPKFGLVVIGEVDPARMVTNGNAEAGDSLVLTKPLGTGIVATAIKKDQASESVIREAVRVMTTLNRDAATVMSRTGIRAATDVTGFGLLGHLRTLLRASGVSAELSADAIPLLPGIDALIADGHIPGGTRRNLEDVSSDVIFSDDVDPVVRTALADAQTSGGLLMSVPKADLDLLLTELEAHGSSAWVIGAVREGSPGTITVR